MNFVKDIIEKKAASTGFIGNLNEQKKNNTLLNEGLEMLGAIKANHSSAILEIYKVAFHDGQDYEIKDRWREAVAIRKLPELISCFILTNTNPFVPIKPSERKNNLVEEICRFESNYQKDTLESEFGFNPHPTKYDGMLEQNFMRLFSRVDAILKRQENIRDNNFKKMFDNSFEKIERFLNRLQLTPEKIIPVRFDENINAKELCEKAEKLLLDLERFKISEAGQALLNFTPKTKSI